ncbi:N-acetylmuramic acid 6-phosphate etherase [Actinomycetota bacterium]|nr:N-acetylmuramic acid 6-phosphate etherase [Actinomycetota bacterium]
MLSDPDRLDALLDELATLTTEAADPARDDIESLGTLELVRAMNANDQAVPGVIGSQAEAIARAVDGIVERMRRGGRLLYVGAGTAGRIGILDASECPPTFGIDPSLVVGLIAGGPRAIQQAVESSEDDPGSAATELEALHLAATDVVVGISASGRTPYVLGALRYARGVGALTVGVVSNHASPVAAAADVPIEVVVGPEFVAGSTRLKAGTAQKLVVNMLSTLTMVRLGKTYRGVMVDLVATNEKLRARSVRTVATLTGASVEQSLRTLEACAGSVKAAVLVLSAGVAPDEATALLAEEDGHLAAALRRARPAS